MLLALCLSVSFYSWKKDFIGVLMRFPGYFIQARVLIAAQSFLVRAILIEITTGAN